VEAQVRLDPAPDGRGTSFGVRAQPGARRTGLNGTWNGMLKVGLAAPPEDGRANEELVRALAGILGVRASSLRLLSGARSRTKRFFVEIDPAECGSRIEAALSTAGRKGAGP
jgi:uncharacterized protein YggU (UPF0235/DUF167 family)